MRQARTALRSPLPCRRLGAPLRPALLVLALVLGCDGGHPTPDGRPPVDASGSPDGAPDAPAPSSDLARLEALVAALPAAGSTAEREALVRAFMTEVEYGEHGFPIRAPGVLAVAFHDEANLPGTVALAGDFNGWDPSGLPLLRPVADVPFFYRIVPVDEPLGRSLYKLVRDGTTWFADPAARRFGYDSFGQYSLTGGGPDASHLERWRRFEAGDGLAARDLFVYVPAGAGAGGARHPVLYMHDGQNVFDPTTGWGGFRAAEAADARIASGQAQRFFLVAIPNTPDRIEEYTHTEDDFGQGPIGGTADAYLGFLVARVKPFVDARYPTRPEATSTGILGASLGGLVSLYAGYRHPEVFAHAGSMSGTVGWGRIGLANPTILALYGGAPPLGVSIYLDAGGDDGGGCVDSDGDGVRDDSPGADNFCENMQLAELLDAIGWTPGVDLLHRLYPGAPHNEAAWAERLPAIFSDWFPGP